MERMSNWKYNRQRMAVNLDNVWKTTDNQTTLFASESVPLPAALGL
jgi:hypothetical protein